MLFFRAGLYPISFKTDFIFYSTEKQVNAQIKCELPPYMVLLVVVSRTWTATALVVSPAGQSFSRYIELLIERYCKQNTTPEAANRPVNSSDKYSPFPFP